MIIPMLMGRSLLAIPTIQHQPSHLIGSRDQQTEAATESAAFQNSDSAEGHRP
jgi:hypothetical protein